MSCVQTGAAHTDNLRFAAAGGLGLRADYEDEEEGFGALGVRTAPRVRQLARRATALSRMQ
jgi:hypothetical protein